MSLSIGIVGLPNVGKSTLFETITKKQVDKENYPFCTIDPNVGVVAVLDERVDKLTDLSKSAKKIYTTIEFVDIAGLVKGASQGEGLGNQFLSHIRECDAICEVVRDFVDDNIVHVNGKIDPADDKETINTELILADLSTVEKRLAKVSKEARSGDKDAKSLESLLIKLKDILGAGKSVRTLELDDDSRKIIKTLNLLTIKPILYVLNSDNEEYEFKTEDGEILSLNVKQEEEIAGLSEEEQAEYVKELGLKKTGLDKLIQTSYKLLNLITFFTTGADETRAWTAQANSKAPEVAGVIHTDFTKGFIRAEVINWEKFVTAGGEIQAKEKGLIRTEGKEYVVQDGDVCNFLVGN